MQVVAGCDLTPGETSDGETVDEATGTHVYRYSGDDIDVTGFDTQCLRGRDRLTVIVSNLPTGDITVLDADYDFTLVGTGKATGRDR